MLADVTGWEGVSSRGPPPTDPQPENTSDGPTRRGVLQNICPGLLRAVQVMENKGQPCTCHTWRWPRGQPDCGVLSLTLEEKKTLAENGRLSKYLVNRVFVPLSAFRSDQRYARGRHEGKLGEGDLCAILPAFSWSKRPENKQ